MANYPVKLLKDKDGTAFVPVVNSDSIITPEGDTLNDLLEEKQDLLTSGTNIKTINNESLLGSGNISIHGASKYDLAQLRSLTDPSSDLYTGLITDIRNKKPIILYEEANGIYTKYMVISSLERQGMIGLFYQPDSAAEIRPRKTFNVEYALSIVSSNGTLVVQENVVPKGEIIFGRVESIMAALVLANQPLGFVTGDMSEVKGREDDVGWKKINLTNSECFVLTNKEPFKDGASTGIIGYIGTVLVNGISYLVTKVVYYNTTTRDFDIVSTGINPLYEEFQEMKENKLEVSNIIAGSNITLTTEGNDITIESSSSSGIQTLVGTQEEPINLNTIDSGIYNISGYYTAGTYTTSLSDSTMFIVTEYSSGSYKYRNVFQDNPSTQPGLNYYYIWDQGNGSYSKGNSQTVRITDTYDRLMLPDLQVVNGASHSIYGYQLLFPKANGTWQGICKTRTTSANKTVTTEGILPGQVLYYDYQSSSACATGSSTYANLLYSSYSAVNVRYNFNVIQLEMKKPVYLKGTIGNDGLYYLDTTTWWSQTLPSTEDGYVYMYLGEMKSTTEMILQPFHPMYEYKNGKIREYQQDSGGPSAWGSITGTLSNQTDLQTELSNKASKSFYSDTTINVGRKRNTTVGTNSTAEGIDTTASGVASHAEGWDTTASGQSSHAEGEQTTASGLWSHAEGNQTTASGENSHAEGEATEASGDCSHAEGFQTTSSGEISHAEGWTTTASGVHSHAEGENTVANSEAQHVFGRYNILDTNNDTTNYGTYVEIVGNGASRDARSNARTLDWSGNETLAGDLTSSGTVKATKGLWSRPTGEVGIATSDSNSCLLIKRASNSEAPNNGVVLEFGNSADWRGQLYIGDNATQGIWYNGWSNGVRGTWRKLGDAPVTLYDNTSGTNGNLTLSESAANFTYLEVFYQYGGTNDYTSYTSSKIYAPNGKKINLSIYLAGSSGTNIQFYTSIYAINGTSMTLSNWYGNGNISNNAVSAVSKTASIRIVRVVGYR